MDGGCRRRNWSELSQSLRGAFWTTRRLFLRPCRSPEWETPISIRSSRLVAEWRERLLAERERSTALVELVEKAVLTDEGIRLGLNLPVPCGGPGGAPLRKVLHLFRFVPLKVKRRGVEMRLIINGGDEPRKPDPALLKAFARARGWFEELASGRVRSLVEIARREGLAKRYVTRLTKLAFVSPAFVDAIAEGEVPPRPTCRC